MNARRKPRALPGPWSPGRGLQAEVSAEHGRAAGSHSHNPVAQAELPGEDRDGGSSPARRGDQARSALPRSPSGSAPAPGRPPSRAAALQTLAAEMIPGTRRRRGPERGPIPGRATEAGPASPRDPAGAGWRYGPARPRRTRTLQALGPFPWQPRGLRRPTAAKPRCVSSRGHRGSGRGSPGTPGTPADPFPHSLSTFLLENPLPPPHSTAVFSKS